MDFHQAVAEQQAKGQNGNFRVPSDPPLLVTSATSDKISHSFGWFVPDWNFRTPLHHQLCYETWIFGWNTSERLVRNLPYCPPLWKSCQSLTWKLQTLPSLKYPQLAKIEEVGKLERLKFFIFNPNIGKTSHGRWLQWRLFTWTVYHLVIVSDDDVFRKFYQAADESLDWWLKRVLGIMLTPIWRFTRWIWFSLN